MHILRPGFLDTLEDVIKQKIRVNMLKKSTLYIHKFTPESSVDDLRGRGGVKKTKGL